MDLELSGRRVLVTGGSRGIGRATVELLAAEGAKVATCARGGEALNEMVAALRSRGADVAASPVDVTDGEALERWIGSTADAWGGVDGLVSNVSARVYRSDIGRWQDTFEIDLLQHVRTIESTLPHLRQSAGSIVVVSSIAAVLSQLPELDRAYGPMKAALASYASQLAQIVGVDGVRINAVSPGPVHVDGGFWDHVKQQQPDLYAGAERLSVFKRLGRPDEIARSIVFLLSPASSYTTAANLHVDGGAVKTVRY